MPVKLPFAVKLSIRQQLITSYFWNSISFIPEYYPHYSRIIVKGPSFTSSTAISAPKEPCSTTGTKALHRSIKYSYNSSASFGLPVPVNPGRLPCDVSAYKVNCDTIRSSPPTSLSDRFVFPFSSAKIRSAVILVTIRSTISLVSACPTPTRTRNPLPIFPTTT